MKLRTSHRLTRCETHQSRHRQISKAILLVQLLVSHFYYGYRKSYINSRLDPRNLPYSLLATARYPDMTLLL